MTCNEAIFECATRFEIAQNEGTPSQLCRTVLATFCLFDDPGRGVAHRVAVRIRAIDRTGGDGGAWLRVGHAVHALFPFMMRPVHHHAFPSKYCTVSVLAKEAEESERGEATLLSENWCDSCVDRRGRSLAGESGADIAAWLQERAPNDFSYALFAID